MSKWTSTLRRALVAVRVVRCPDLTGDYVAEQPSPDQLVSGELLVIRDGVIHKSAAFRCPGGCGHRIRLLLSPNSRPRWEVTID
jgi:hypothetical protein